jgi:tellurite resistance-related uncharacterized protein
MNYQNATLPDSATKVGSTPLMTQDTIVPGILKKHLAPKGKWGFLEVESGSLQFIWEDESDAPIDAVPGHPIVVFPERFHHVKITGPVSFRLGFYVVEESDPSAAQQGDRPGAAFLAE